MELSKGATIKVEEVTLTKSTIEIKVNQSKIALRMNEASKKSRLNMQNKIITIALVGQPNVGKSMLINSISNARLKVGNFSGKVCKRRSFFDYKDYETKL